jgi:hypothetical protein
MGFTDYKFRYSIEADGSKAKAEVKTVETAFNRLHKSSTGLQGGIKNVASEVSNIVASLTGDRLSGASSQVTSLANAFGAIPGPAGLAVGAVAGLGVAAVGAGGALLELTKKASDYGSVIHDASDKTGLHAETLSAMDVAAKQSGTSLEQVTGSIQKFAQTVGQAAEGSDKAAKSLVALGLDPKKAAEDLDGALAQVFKRIADARTPVEANTLAFQAFGKQGKELLPFIKQFDGDLPGLISKMKELGVTIGDKDAAAADEFGDQMALVTTQVERAGMKIGTAFMPMFYKMATDLSGWLSKNQNEITSWADKFAWFVDKVIKGAAITISTLKNYYQSYKSFMDSIGLGFLVPRPFLYDYFNNAYNAENKGQPSESTGLGPHLPGGALPDVYGKSPKAKKPPNETDTQFRKFFEEQGFNVTRTFGDALNKGSLHPLGLAADVSVRGKSTDDIAKLIAAAIEKGYRLVDERKKIPGVYQTGPHLHFERNGSDKASVFQDQSMYGKVPVGYLQDLDKNRRGKVAGGTDAVDKYKTDQLKKDEDAFREYWEFKKDIQRSGVEYLLAQTESEIKIYDETGAAYETATQKATEIAHLKTQLYQDEIDALENLFDNTADLNKQAQIRQQIDLKTIEMQRAAIGIEDERAASVKRLTDKFYDLTSGVKAAESATEDFIQSTNGGIGESSTGTGVSKEPSFLQNLLSQLGIDGNENAFDVAKQQLSDFTSFAVDVVGQMTSAVEQSIEAWILYGDSIGGSLKKATAAVLAQISAQALVKAIFEAAEGIAALAVGNFGAAALHFEAAAGYGILAAGTGLAGRALAGGKDKKGKGSSSSSSATSSSKSNINQNPSAYSRASSTAYDSGDRHARIVQQAIDRHTEALEKIHAKIDSMPAGDVLTRGMQQRPGAVGNQVHADMGRNRGISIKIGSRLGLK